MVSAGDRLGVYDDAVDLSAPVVPVGDGALGCWAAARDVWLEAFVAEYEATYLQAAACLAGNREPLRPFFACPAEHWTHLRTTNVIESPVATVRLRQRVTKGAGSRTQGLLMACKLLGMAPRRWRRLNGAHLLPLVRAAVVFVDGVQKERNAEGDRKEAA